MIQEMLKAEIDTHLGYKKHKKTDKTTNSCNGKNRKTITSEYGEQEIAVSRDQRGEFESHVVKKYPSNVTGIEDQIIALYAKVSVRGRLKIIFTISTALTYPRRSFPMSRIKSCLWLKSGRIGRYRASTPSSFWMPSTLK